MSLFQADYEVLGAARRNLADGAAALNDHIADAGDNFDAAHMGRVIEAWEIAEAAVFNALNSAAAYLDDIDADRAMWKP